MGPCPHCRRPIPLYDPGYPCSACGVGGPIPASAYHGEARVIDLCSPQAGARCRHVHAFSLLRVPRGGGRVVFLSDDRVATNLIARGLARGETGPNRLVLLFVGPRGRSAHTSYSVRLGPDGRPLALRLFSRAGFDLLERA